MPKPLAAVAAASLLFAASPAPAQAPIPAEWSIEPRASSPSGDMVQFNITYEGRGGRRSTTNGPRRLDELNGLTREQLSAEAATPVRFTIARDAGTLACQGTAQRRHARGACAFHASATYPDALVARGMGRPEPRDQLHMTLHDVSLAYAAEFQRLGYQGLAPSKLIGMRIHEVSGAQVRAFRELGYDRLTADELTALQVHDVTPRRARDLLGLGLGEVRVGDLVAMAVHDVTPDYVRELRGLGYANVGARRLVAMRIHDVTPAYIRELHSQGHQDLSPDQLISMRIHGAAAQRVRARGRAR